MGFVVRISTFKMSILVLTVLNLSWQAETTFSIKVILEGDIWSTGSKILDTNVNHGGGMQAYGGES